MLFRRSLPSAVLGLALLLAVPATASACPFCPSAGQTLLGEVNQAHLIVFGTLSNAQRDPNEFGKGTTDMDIEVVVKIEGGPEPIQVRKTVPSVAAGAAATATLGLPQDPPFGAAVTISVQIRPVPGEEKKDNNSAEYDAFFTQG